MPQSSSLSTTDPIRARALRFAETFDWINPVIVAEQPANPDTVVRFGNGPPSGYREFTVELQWSANARCHVSLCLANLLDAAPAALTALGSH